MPTVHEPVWSSPYNQLDPERARVREEIRQQAVRDATAATDAVRVKLRRNLAAATKASGRVTALPERSSTDGTS